VCVCVWGGGVALCGDHHQQLTLHSGASASICLLSVAGQRQRGSRCGIGSRCDWRQVCGIGSRCIGGRCVALAAADSQQPRGIITREWHHSLVMMPHAAGLLLCRPCERCTLAGALLGCPVWVVVGGWGGGRSPPLNTGLTGENGGQTDEFIGSHPQSTSCWFQQ